LAVDNSLMLKRDNRRDWAVKNEMDKEIITPITI